VLGGAMKVHHLGLHASQNFMSVDNGMLKIML